MLARDPFRHVGPYGEPRKTGRARRRLTFAGECLLAAIAVAAVLLAVGAIGRAATYHGTPERPAGISEPHTAWPELTSEAVTAGAERIHAR